MREWVGVGLGAHQLMCIIINSQCSRASLFCLSTAKGRWGFNDVALSRLVLFFTVFIARSRVIVNDVGRKRLLLDFIISTTSLQAGYVTNRYS